MIWLASYPRSGNTFFRIVLSEVYGIESRTYHREAAYPVDEDYDKYPVVKTHLLPRQLVPDDPDIPAVYLVRDGRDVVVSMAHQRKDIIAKDSDFTQNLEAVILAKKGSHFGGWSKNIVQWLQRAEIVIRFEDLIKNPIECVERLRPIIELPEPKIERVPSFEELRSRDFKYGSGLEHGFSKEEREVQRRNFFRRGKVGSWREDMSEEMQELFWYMHGDAMEKLGYTDVTKL
jgi:hypothetical protein